MFPPCFQWEIFRCLWSTIWIYSQLITEYFKIESTTNLYSYLKCHSIISYEYNLCSAIRAPKNFLFLNMLEVSCALTNNISSRMLLKSCLATLLSWHIFQTLPLIVYGYYDAIVFPQIHQLKGCVPLLYMGIFSHALD